MSSNFQVFDSAKANIMSDSDYTASTWRANGNQAGIAPADVYNKLFYQTSVFAAAYAAALSAAGYTVSDSSLSTLTTVLANQVIVTGSAYIKFGTGIMIQEATATSWSTGVSIAEATITWPVNFYDTSYGTYGMCAVADSSWPMVMSEKVSARSVSGTKMFLQRVDQALATGSPAMTIQVFGIGRWQ
jgi:hypothetical protein